MSRKHFRQRLRAEWQRLNPRFVLPEHSLGQCFVAACREGLYGFFAPLRLLWWLVTRSWKLRQISGVINHRD